MLPQLIREVNNELTMESRDIVALINQERSRLYNENGGKLYPSLRHDNFMAKIEEEFGGVALNFKGYYIAMNGKQKPLRRGQ